MKKKYLTPALTVQEYETMRPLAVSGVTSHLDDIDIAYGGVDEEGELEADSRYQDYDVWEDEEAAEEKDW